MRALVVAIAVCVAAALVAPHHATAAPPKAPAAKTKPAPEKTPPKKSAKKKPAKKETNPKGTTPVYWRSKKGKSDKR